MTNTEHTAAAHIITGNATGLGDPEILIMTRDGEGTGAATIIACHPIDAAALLGDALDIMQDYMGWTGPGGRCVQVQPGYFVVNVQRAWHRPPANRTTGATA